MEGYGANIVLIGIPHGPPGPAATVGRKTRRMPSAAVLLRINVRKPAEAQALLHRGTRAAGAAAAT